MTYTFEFINEIEDNITEVTYDGTQKNLFNRIYEHLNQQ
ncbi:hypothetical protein SPJ2_1200 [Streptococcus parauberis KRS-02109]|uniref:Uncharacterized protein n=1 Tax=Streptococcus parauberis KRS-02083 TaxID=1207545 RepID=A0ABN0IPK3_9STRE|nr:hypothetical protein SPJ2_1200 [Streptococcus parauberis KRS-02109]EMG24765.1 hypothetical protein SPJ1_1859 [Streptococcus parauberis KRS-02083]